MRFFDGSRWLTAIFSEDPGNIESQWWCKPDGRHRYHVPYTAQGIRHALGWHKQPAKLTKKAVREVVAELEQIYDDMVSRRWSGRLNQTWWEAIARHILKNYEKRVRD